MLAGEAGGAEDGSGAQLGTVMVTHHIYFEGNKIGFAVMLANVV